MMNKTEIYYFSGTGNSFVVARDIAEKIKGNLISIPSVMDNERITINADVIGIVFPVYYVGLTNIPLIVKQFVIKLNKISTKYIFAVCTYGGGFGSTLKILDEVIKSQNGRLAAGFGIQMPQNAFKKPFENKTKLYNNWKEKKLISIYEYVNAKNEGNFDSDGFFTRPIVTILELLMKSHFLKPFFLKSMNRTTGFPKGSDLTIEEIISLMDRSYHTDEKCIGCSTCSKVCPVHNIKIVDNKPVWQHHCENCLACIKWCSQKAIHGYGELPRGYHHPDVKISDMWRKD